MTFLKRPIYSALLQSLHSPQNIAGRSAMTIGTRFAGQIAIRVGTRIATRIATWVLAAASAVMFSGIANAAEIKVIGSPGTREPYTLLVPGFEKTTGHKVTTTWGGVTAVPKRVGYAVLAYVVMLPPAQIDDLINEGKLVAHRRVNVASSGIGVAIRAGAP